MWDRQPHLRQAGLDLPAAGATSPPIEIQAGLKCLGWIYDWQTSGGDPLAQRFYVDLIVQTPGVTASRRLVQQADFFPAGRLFLPFPSVIVKFLADADNGAGAVPSISYAAYPVLAADSFDGIGSRELTWVQAAAGTTTSETLTVPDGAVAFRPVQAVDGPSANFNRQRRDLSGGGAWVDAGGTAVVGGGSTVAGQSLGGWLPIGQHDRVEILSAAAGDQRWVEWLYRW
jgi:hypothetical protein